MEPFTVGIASLILIVLLIWCGCYVGIALSLVSFFGVWAIKSDPVIAVRMMTLSVTETVKHVDYAAIPTFVMMGLIVGKSGFGADIYEVANEVFRRLRGGLGIATVAANAAFAAALSAARAMPLWRVVGEHTGEGRIAAEATTARLRFVDDIEIRVEAREGGSRVRVRSASRVGTTDFGTNARRIRAYLARLATAPGV